MTQTAKGNLPATSQPLDMIVQEGKGLVPKNFYHLWELAKIWHASGLATKSLKSTEQVFIAMEMGMSIGMSPSFSVQNIAVINGKPSIYGDAALALIKASSQLEDFHEWFDGTGDDFTAFCMAKRTGEKRKVERAFSFADARQAGLLSKDGPWKQYPKRMAQMRARSWALRDSFPDVLQGVSIVEEVIDIPEAEYTVESAQDLKAKTDAKVLEMKKRMGQPEPEQEEPDPSLKCPHCDFETTSEMGLKRHVNRCPHKESAKENGQEQPGQPEEEKTTSSTGSEEGEPETNGPTREEVSAAATKIVKALERDKISFERFSEYLGKPMKELTDSEIMDLAADLKGTIDEYENWSFKAFKNGGGQDG